MKVLKFGGASLASPERMKSVASLIGGNTPQIVIFSAATETTMALREIAACLYTNEVKKARQLINRLEFKFINFLNDLYELERTKQLAIDYILSKFESLWAYSRGAFFATQEKEILLQGELISSHLLSFYLGERGVKSAILPAVDFMRTGVHAELDMEYLEEKLHVALDLYPETTLFITQGAVCRNAYDEVDQLKQGGADYSALLIGAAVQAEEIQFWNDVNGTGYSESDKVKRIVLTSDF